jgi:hypothetical protein
MSCFVPHSTTPNLNSSDDPQNNRFTLLNQNLDDSLAGPSTTTLNNDQLVSATASHLHISSIEQRATPYPQRHFLWLTTFLCSTSTTSFITIGSYHRTTSWLMSSQPKRPKTENFFGLSSLSSSMLTWSSTLLCLCLAPSTR